MNPPHISPRHDPYRNIHKGLRAAMFDTLHRLGSTDAEDGAALTAALDQAERLLALLGAHVKHENEHLHTAIEARAPGAARHTTDDHQAHDEALALLRAQVAAVRGASSRAERLHRLYLDLAEFVADNLRHMRVEETRNNAMLWTLYSDAEVVSIHDRLLASVDPSVLEEAMVWMARAVNLPELVGLLTEIRGKAPAPAFEALLGRLRAGVDPARWSRLARELAVPETAATARVAVRPEGRTETAWPVPSFRPPLDMQANTCI